MSLQKTQIEIYPEDEFTLLDTKQLTKAGYGHDSTIKRKIKKNDFPAPVQQDGKRKWTVAQIKRHLQQKFSQQVAA